MATAPLIGAREFDHGKEFPVPVDGTSGVLHHAPSAATAAVCTLDADTERENMLTRITCSYSATPTGGSIKVESPSSTVVWGPHAIERAGTHQFELAIKTAKNQALIVTLASGAGAVVGVLDIEGHRLH